MADRCVANADDGCRRVTSFPADSDAPKGLESLVAQHAEGMSAYAKLFFWSFVAGFNQKYVVDIINSVKTKP